jgi:hypothetical protein
MSPTAVRGPKTMTYITPEVIMAGIRMVPDIALRAS